MLFLWTTTKLGKIWLDGDAFRAIVSKRLPAGFYCHEVNFIGEKNLLNIHITMSDENAVDEKAKLERKFEELFSKSGIATHVSWMYVSPQDNPKATPLWTLPLFWAAVAAALTAVVHLGLKGILWSLFAAIIGYGVSWLFVTEDGQKQITSLMEQFRR